MPIYKNKNEDFFKKWSSGMSYVLGFFVADGCMIKNNRGAHFIEFHITDEDILEKIRALMKSDNKISKRKTKPNLKNAFRLQIGSKEIFNDLKNLGITPRKSNIIEMPSVPRKYFKDFVRGYFDGDGNVYAGEYQKFGRDNKSTTLLSGFTCGSRKFLEELHRELKNEAFILGGTLHEIKGYYRLYFSVKDSCKLYKFMYNTKGDLFLKRKRNIFEKYFNKCNMKIN